MLWPVLLSLVLRAQRGKVGRGLTCDEHDLSLVVDREHSGCAGGGQCLPCYRSMPNHRDDAYRGVYSVSPLVVDFCTLADCRPRSGYHGCSAQYPADRVYQVMSLIRVPMKPEADLVSHLCCDSRSACIAATLGLLDSTIRHEPLQIVRNVRRAGPFQI